MLQCKICYTEMTNSLQFTTNVLKSPPPTSVPLCHSWAKILCCSSQLIFTFLYAGSSIQNAGEQFVWCIRLSFVNFALNSAPHTQILTEFGLEIQTVVCLSVCLSVCNHSELDTSPYEPFFSQWRILSPPKTLTFSSESPCIIGNLKMVKDKLYLRTPLWRMEGADRRTAPFIPNLDTWCRLAVSFTTWLHYPQE
jgi:hypothetical protein